MLTNDLLIRIKGIVLTNVLEPAYRQAGLDRNREPWIFKIGLCLLNT